jgi:hypothetical protein
LLLRVWVGYHLGARCAVHALQLPPQHVDFVLLRRVDVLELPDEIALTLMLRDC